jgi:uncharacterized OsmC-like protein
MADGERSVRIEQQQDYRVAIVWDPSQPPLVADEPPPLGAGAGPSPGQLLLGAVGNCMTDSLLFALRKFKLDAEPLSARVDATVGRNEQGRQRFLSIEVVLALGKLPEDASKLARVLGQFEEFCTVGRSVAQGIPTRVSVRGPDGALLHGDAA